MYLKNLEMSGFKSFADKINIDFPYNFTCVVGPNGSGKSNILDAIRFVLGEQSSKTLRGNKMDDVIFMGTETKKPVGLCKVTLTFDNTSKILNSELEEVIITRKLYKTGESEYILNGKDVRLRDISNLFMDTGLSKDGFSIISQGKIDNILSQKSSDRREFFDEATGITKYKYQKDESVKQIAKTNQNILRLNDVLLEKEKRLEPLREQSKKANLYIDLTKELKENEISLHKIDILTFEDTIKLEKNNLDRCKEDIYDVKISYNQNNLEINKINININKIDKDIQEISENSSKKYNEFMENKSKLNELETNTSHTTSNINRINDEISEQKSEILELSNKINSEQNEVKIKRKQLENYLLEKARLEKDKNTKLDSICTINTYKQEIMVKKQTIKNKLYENDLNIKKDKQELEFYQNIIDSLSDMPKAVSSILKNTRLKGIHKTFGQVIKVENNHILAINSALSGKINNIIVETSDDAINAISYLKSNKLGVCTFLPINKIKERQTPNINTKFNGFLGFANQLILCENIYKNIVNSFLSDIIVCDTAENAKNMASKLNYKIVTLDGEVFYKGGAISGGFNRKSSSTLLNQRKITEISHTIELKSDIKLEFENKLLELDKDIQNGCFDEKIIKLNHEICNFDLKLSEINSKIYKDQSFIENFSDDYFLKEVTLKNEKISSKYIEIEKLNKQIEDYNILITHVKKSIKSYDESKFKEKINQFKLLKQNHLDKIDGLKKSSGEITEKRIELEKRFVTLENKIDNLYQKQNHIISKLWEKYSLTFSSVMEIKTLNESYEILSQNVLRIQNRVSGLGNVNLDSREEYLTVLDEYNFLNEQVLDLENSRKEIEKVLEKLTKNMKNIFIDEFFKLNENFKEVFQDLFSGGSAHLELSDNLNILESGIEIKVNPPGKKFKSLSLLSGGERAFVAIAIFFAILKCRKTPFCVLDEIDSALDDVNVHKFSNYLKNHSNDTQFVVITHRKGTMEYADILYGVTMEQKGVSKMLRINLDK